MPGRQSNACVRLHQVVSNGTHRCSRRPHLGLQQPESPEPLMDPLHEPEPPHDPDPLPDHPPLLPEPPIESPEPLMEPLPALPDPLPLPLPESPEPLLEPLPPEPLMEPLPALPDPMPLPPLPELLLLPPLALLLPLLPLLPLPVSIYSYSYSPPLPAAPAVYSSLPPYLLRSLSPVGSARVASIHARTRAAQSAARAARGGGLPDGGAAARAGDQSQT